MSRISSNVSSLEGQSYSPIFSESSSAQSFKALGGARSLGLKTKKIVWWFGT